MSDSPPPDGGPGPYDGWDLEGLLSGTPGRVPEGMRPVAKTLGALRAAPMPGELVGEASARAMFRQIMSDNDNALPRSDGGEALPRSDGGAGSAHPVARTPHSHRRPSRRGRWRVAALASTAVAVVAITGAAALAGAFSGTGGHPGQPNDLGAASATSPVGRTSPAANRLEGSATKVPAARPTPSASASEQGADETTVPGPAELCRQYLAFLSAHPGSHADKAAEKSDFKQLSDLAGGPGNISSYCMKSQQWTAAQGPGPSSGPASPPPGDSSGTQDSQGGQGPQDSPVPVPPNQQGATPPAQNAGNGSGGNSQGNQNQQ